MISRRKLLVGTAGAAVVGAAGVGVIGPRRIGRKIGLIHSADRTAPASNWPVKEMTLSSDAMKGEVRWAMARPVEQPKGIVVCLHGRGGTRRSAFDDMRLHDVVAEAHASLAVVGVDGTDHAYWHRRTNGIDPLTMVIDELLPAIDQLLGPGLPRAVMGWSMGGYGTLLAAERNPTLFKAAVAVSPALWLRASESADGAFDSLADFAANDVFADTSPLRTLAVRVDCGLDDGFINAAKAFAAKLPNPNLGQFSPGQHDGPYWRSSAPAQIATITQALGT